MIDTTRTPAVPGNTDRRAYCIRYST